MKEQMKSATLPTLPIVGQLRLSTRDGKSLSNIEVVPEGEPDTLDPFFEASYRALRNYLSGQSREISIPVDMRGLTDFQQRVLGEMKKVGHGSVATYKDIAEGLDSRGYQAIGTACGRNPFMLIYPCHRILGTRGLGGFAHGIKMKLELLTLEGALNCFQLTLPEAGRNPAALGPS